MKSHFIPETRPIAREENCIRGPFYRITVLTSALLRIEYDPEERFEDRPTQAVWFRDFPEVPFSLSRGPHGITVRTEEILLRYDEKKPSAFGMTVRRFGFETEWRYADAHPVSNLKGTAASLDGTDGSADLGDGVISREGIALYDDSRSAAYVPETGLEVRREGVYDLYVFAYGHEYQRAIRDWCALCGKVPMLPRFALGNWWSRYYRYTQAEYLGLMDRFAREGIPLSVAVLDMDWHITDVDPRFFEGWTGFTWNEELFPDHRAFLRDLRARGLKTALNLHQGGGIRAFDEAYPRLAEHMGIDPGTGETAAFDPCSQTFMERYCEDVLNPMEDEGVDFWWTDWAPGWTRYSSIPELEPLWPINHYQFLDSGRGGKRPMTFSRYAGPGGHRYPVGFSGDTNMSWSSLRFQPRFTATAGNVGFFWWSHDIGGHYGGEGDRELMARWTQFGVFSPVMRLHSGSSPFNTREPWRFGPEVCRIMKEYLRLRHRMLPYLYTMNRRASEECVPLMIPLYHLHPEAGWAYGYPNEYYFGSELLVVPVTTPVNPKLGLAGESVYLPDGIWHDVFTRRIYRGGREIRAYRPLDQMPVFAGAGAIIPLTDEIDGNAAAGNPEQLHLCVCLGADGGFILYEDDNETTAYEHGVSAYTDMTLEDSPEKTVFTVCAPRGHTELLPGARRYAVEFFGCADCADCLMVRAGGKAVGFTAEYRKESRSLTVECGPVSVGEELTFSFSRGASDLRNNTEEEIFAFLDGARYSFGLRENLWSLCASGKSLARKLYEMRQMRLDPDLEAALTELLTALDWE